MSEDKNFLDIAEELNDGSDALKDELLSVEKKDKKIKHLGMKKTLVIMGIAIVLIVAIIICYMSFGKNDQNGNNVQMIEVLYDYEKTQVLKVDIQNNVTKEHIVLNSVIAGTAQKWKIEGQRDSDIDQTKAKNIAQFASHLESKYVVEYNEGLLSEYGLLSPSAEVAITYADGKEVKLKIGNTYGNSEGAYVLMEGTEKIYIVTDYARMYFTYKLTDLLMLPTLSKTAASAQTVSIFDAQRNQTTLSYLEDPMYGTDAWFLVSPAHSETNSEEVDSLFSYIRSLELDAYYCDEAGDDLSIYGFDKPNYELQSYDSERNLLDHFIVGKKVDDESGNYYCMLIGRDEEFGKSPVYLISENSLKTIYANPVTLANPYLLALNINWLRSGKIIVDGQVYEITIERQLKYDDEGKILYNDDGTENTINTYYINGKKLDETQFKYFYRTFLFLQVEGVVPADTEKKEAIWQYELNVVIPILNSSTGKYDMKEELYTGTYYLVNDTFAVFENNQSDKAVFTVRTTSIERLKDALGLLLEGKMPTQ